MTNLDRPSVRRVQDALRAADAAAEIVELSDTARTAQDAANALGCPLGAIVKSLVFACGEEPVMALVAGDRQCDPEQLRAALGRTAAVKRADADLVRSATGFSIGGVAPVAHATTIPIAIDESLRRFDRIYAAAGHTHCVFATTPDELVRITGGRLAADIAR